MEHILKYLAGSNHQPRDIVLPAMEGIKILYSMYLQVGLACCQFFCAYGCTVLGTAGTESGMQNAKKAGASQVFNHRQADYKSEIKVRIWK